MTLTRSRLKNRCPSRFNCTVLTRVIIDTDTDVASGGIHDVEATGAILTWSQNTTTICSYWEGGGGRERRERERKKEREGEREREREREGGFSL